jgi:D-alanyl-D-alanine dipeptidase
MKGATMSAVLLADIADAPIGLEDCGEPLVDLRTLPRAIVDESRSQISSRSECFCWAREGVAGRLAAAARRLPAGYSLCIKEAYRPPERQRLSFERCLAKYREAHPGLSAPELKRLVSQYVAPLEVAGHPTGGAVDVTLWKEGRELWMGTEFNAEPEDTGNRTWMDSPDIDDEATVNRAVLASALGGAGFVNYPPEWWHWSFGDKYWAFLSGRPAIYGLLAEPSAESRAALSHESRS